MRVVKEAEEGRRTKGAHDIDNIVFVQSMKKASKQGLMEGGKRRTCGGRHGGMA